MAEAVGLALGGIALVSLVSTCVEILEYVESARDLARDFRLALTKVSLIKQRLTDWGTAMSIDEATGPEDGITRPSWSNDCGVLIRDTLWGIKDLLEKTSRMSRRHSFHTEEKRPIGYAVAPLLPIPPLRFPSDISEHATDSWYQLIVHTHRPLGRLLCCLLRRCLLCRLPCRHSKARPRTAPRLPLDQPAHDVRSF